MWPRRYLSRALAIGAPPLIVVGDSAVRPGWWVIVAQILWLLSKQLSELQSKLLLGNGARTFSRALIVPLNFRCVPAVVWQ